MRRRLASFLVVALAATAAGGCSSTTCDDTMPGAVYCWEGAEGTGGWSTYALGGSNGTVVFASHESLERVAEIDESEVLFDDFGDGVPNLRIHGSEACYVHGGIFGGAIDCAAVGGGRRRRWLSTLPTGEVPLQTVPLVGGDEWVVTFYRPLSRTEATTLLARVDAQGIIRRELGRVPYQVTELVADRSHLYFGETRTERALIHRMALDGETATVEDVVELPSSCRFHRIEDRIFCAEGSRKLHRLAPAPVTEIGELLQWGWRDLVGAGFVGTDGDRVLSMSPTGEEILWTRPRDHARARIDDLAADGDDLLISLSSTPCGSSGVGKNSGYSCGDGYPRVEIVRVPGAVRRSRDHFLR